jgi:hypothetical protein
MNKSHNKKRNIGIIYEQLLRHISDSLVRGDKPGAQRALNIIERRFNRQTEIYREFRLFNALAKTTVSDTPVAAAILTEAKSAARRLDTNKLDHEKSQLIREINYTIGQDLYSRRIPDYKDYATIQTLINDWREGDGADLARMVQYESKVVQHLLEKKDQPLTLENQVKPEADALVVKIMTEKINQKWSDKLNNEQRDILKAYAFHTDEGSVERLQESLGRIKTDALQVLREFKRNNTNPVLAEKVDDVIRSVNEMSFDVVTDETISRFMTLSQMKSELLAGGRDE